MENSNEPPKPDSFNEMSNKNKIALLINVILQPGNNWLPPKFLMIQY